MLRALTVVFALVCLAAEASAQTNWCAGIDTAQVGGLLGAAAPTPMQSGPRKDENAGGVTTLCIFPQGKKAVLAMLVQFTSAAEAQKKLSVEYLRGQQKGDAKYVEEKSPAGDRAFWGATSEGVFYSILRGANVYTTAISGLDTKSSAAAKPSLVKLALSLASK